MKSRSSERSGYAATLALLFIVLFLSLLGIAYRAVVSAAITESVRAQQAKCDEGAVTAVAQGLALLETGLPPANAAPSTTSYTLTNSMSSGSFNVTFTRQQDNFPWTVAADPVLATVSNVTFTPQGNATWTATLNQCQVTFTRQNDATWTVQAAQPGQSSP
jgi:hypothetical protein